MNLKKLFEMQRELDARIEQEHPREPGEDRLAKKILALLVELGELANETRFFKYWSYDQEPRRGGDCFCDEGYVNVYMGYGVVEQELCAICNGTCQKPDPLLEEYVDCLHFILSIGLEIGVCPEELDTEPIFRANITEQFIDLFWEVSQLRYEERNERQYKDYLQYNIVLEHFVGLGELLGFTWEQIEQAYIRKNQINHDRQNNSY